MKKQSEEEIVRSLVRDLSHLGLWTPAFLPAIKRAVKNGEQEYAYQVRRMEPGDVTDYMLTLNLDPGSGPLGPDSYEASVRVVSKRVPGTVPGLDTAALEQELLSLNLDREDALATLADHSHAAFAAPIHQVAELLGSREVAQREAGALLAARYLLRSPVAAILDLSEVARRFERSYHFPISDLATALPAARARNLLLGGSVTTFTGDRVPVWAYLDYEAPVAPELVYAPGFSAGALLAGYDIRETGSASRLMALLEGLQAGERMPVHPHADPERMLLMQADAKNKILLLYDTAGTLLSLEQFPVRDKSILPLKIPEGRWLDRWPGAWRTKGLKV